jgi:DNA invertase Pin-like site-specific DNA recombinase
MMSQARIKAALWVRVSTGDQDASNQLLQLQELVHRRGWIVAKVYRVEASAWKGGHEPGLAEVYRDAKSRRWEVLACWALDRLSRQGPLATLQVVDRLGKAGAQVVSLQEPWLEVSGELRDLLVALTGWIARMESARRSERTRAGLQRAAAEGKRLGRPPGSKDQKKRRRSGYFARYAK